MAPLLPSCTFLLFCAILFASSVSTMRFTERAAIIDSAIAQVQGELGSIQASTQSRRPLTVPQTLIRAFKKSSAASRAQGMARLQFEDTVKLAEKKIIESNRRALGQDVNTLSRSYAKELVHTPGSILRKAEIAQIYYSSGCENYTYENIDCSDDKNTEHYRTVDGSCNNQEYPSYGAVGTQMKRLIPARYEDGISTPRGAMQMKNPSIIEGSPFRPPIPSPRIISLRIVEDEPVEDAKHTHMIMQWGQFMDHDLDSMPEYVEDSCPHTCEVNEDIEGRCAPFPIPCNDYNIDRLDENCHGFRRSLPACTYDGRYSLAPREHFNAITHFIDGSTLYHHDPKTHKRLRLGLDGKLLLDSQNIPSGTSQPSLPQVNRTDDYMACMMLPCYMAGDHRANEQTALTTMHTLWAREHNRIAHEIKKADPTCVDDDVLFGITRHIVVATMQKIMYKDYLPEVLGSEFYNKVKLGDYDKYDEKVNPSIPNAFATAAYRFGHSQVQPSFWRLKVNGDTISKGDLPLVDAFFDTSHINDTGTDPVLRGLFTQPARRVDEFLNEILTNKLFAADVNSTGLDLASLNIMRGRDHGIAPYPVWRKWAMEVCKFTGEEVQIRDPRTEIKLYQVYGSLDSADLFVGGLAEKPLPGGLVGPTFGCIFAQTFLALRDGDRFYYENNDGHFTEEQTKEINAHASLSAVMCDNTEEPFGKVPKHNAFLLNDERIGCDILKRVDLKKWNCDSFTTRRGKEAAVAGKPAISADKELIVLLQSVLDQLEAREATSDTARAAKNMAEGGDSLLSDEEVAEKLEALLYKFKK